MLIIGGTQCRSTIRRKAPRGMWWADARYSWCVLRVRGGDPSGWWYATGRASLSRYADVAEAFTHIASVAYRVVAERDNVSRAVAARHRVGLAQGILMTRRQVTADQAFALLKRQSQNTHVKLRTIAQTVIRPEICRLERRVRPDDTAPTTQPTPASTAGPSSDGATSRTPLPTHIPAQR
jgi:ANTAR domain